ncbi:hypothetical protein [Frigoriglobus tundricola]|uniref:Uncharacterized protein n=1 Tax=Frigoriglobus tundricola TaxID=2774151 RepID=A0A6M5YR82_9BACT|nr:hypothetical protein [Frigoriglobus tundricola]QJW95502.1 hypothetical protein FTUN_3051 [Frigoriglobus tundricola]
MTRTLAAVALLALPAVAPAQTAAPTTSGSAVLIGPPVVGGRLVIAPPITNGSSALYAVQTDVPPPFSVGGGSLSAPPQLWVPSGAWGGDYYQWPVFPIVIEPAPVPTGRAGFRNTELATMNTLSGEASATLVVQLPAAAEIWVGGKKVNGDPAAEWTLTSPTLKVGEAHTFEVKGRWKAGGKTFETSRSVTVAAGLRSRTTVISGTAVKE